MAVSDGVYGPFIRDMAGNVKAFDLDADTFKIGLVTDTHAPDFNADDQWADIDNEVTGTNWAAGGVALASNTSTIAAGIYSFDAANVSEATTTVSNAEAAPIYDSTLVGDDLLVLVDFDAAYSTVAGTFAIAWDSTGIFTIDYIP